MLYLELFLTFFKIGLFTIGGGYAMLPLIQADVQAKGWMTAEELVNFIAVSESTPGPFAVNVSTYVGAELAGLPQIQGDILDNVSRYVKPGGVLLYSTCTLLQAENEDVVTAFLAKHPEYHLESFLLPGPLGEVAAGQCTLWPQRLQTDGFFLAKLRKEGAK